MDTYDLRAHFKKIWLPFSPWKTLAFSKCHKNHWKHTCLDSFEADIEIP